MEPISFEKHLQYGSAVFIGVGTAGCKAIEFLLKHNKYKDNLLIAVENDMDLLSNMIPIEYKIVFMVIDDRMYYYSQWISSLLGKMKERNGLVIGFILQSESYGKSGLVCSEPDHQHFTHKNCDAYFLVNMESVDSLNGSLVVEEKESHLWEIKRITRTIQGILMEFGVVSIDFDDVCKVLRDRGLASFFNLVSEGPERALESARSLRNFLNTQCRKYTSAWILLVIGYCKDDEITMEEVKVILDEVDGKIVCLDDIIWNVLPDQELTAGVSLRVIMAGNCNKY